MSIVLNRIKNYYGNNNIVVFDIGAYDFEDSIRYKTNLNADVYSFEPSDKNYSLYHERALSLNIKPYKLALSDSTGFSKFYSSISLKSEEGIMDWGPSGSILEPSESLKSRISFDDCTTVQTITIEDFCKKNNIDKVDYIHIDVQGMEHRVLKGLGKIRPDYIFAETCEYNSYNGAGTISDLDNYLESIGYLIEERFEYDTLYKKK